MDVNIDPQPPRALEPGARIAGSGSAIYSRRCVLDTAAAQTAANEITVQAGIIERLVAPDMGWTHTCGESTLRKRGDVLIEGEVRAALVRLNPLIAAKPERANEIIVKLHKLIASAREASPAELTLINEKLSRWLRGLQSHRFGGTRSNSHTSIKLIDFDNPRTNSLMVSDEVSFEGPDGTRRYDIVCWINGIPLVVGETKWPSINRGKSTSWFNGARDIHVIYERETTEFFATNVFSFATDGREYRVGAIGQSPEHWLPWRDLDEELDAREGMESVIHAVELMLTPETVLNILQNYVLFMREASPRVVKYVPRYPQLHAVEAIVARALDMDCDRGLVIHHQGTGKTLICGMAAAKLRREHLLDSATILIVVDRIDLVDQVKAELKAAGLENIKLAKTRKELQKLLDEDGADMRGVILTTVQRFGGAKEALNTRRNIVVLVDECHRTQSGAFGEDLRGALPNAKLIGLTGTPVKKGDVDTWASFASSCDPDGILSHYSAAHSVIDGTTVPAKIEPRLVRLHVDKEALNAAYEEFAAAEELTEKEALKLTRRASRLITLLQDRDRVEAVTADIVTHYREHIAPLGMKAQIVAANRQLCVRYLEAIQKLLGPDEEAAIVMSVNSKEDPEDWRQHARDRAGENALKARFKDPADPLKFLIVTAKLLTGFNAPIEGVMYLDKPLTDHTLFQAITRTNRRWTNPVTGQEKRYGLVVDYLGLGEAFGRVLEPPKGKAGGVTKTGAYIDDVVDEFETAMNKALARFKGIVRDGHYGSLMLAQARVATDVELEAFLQEFGVLHGLWEFLYPNRALRPHAADYRWLAKLVDSKRPHEETEGFLWARLGAKTLELIDEHVTASDIEAKDPISLTLDADAAKRIRAILGISDNDPAYVMTTADDVVETIRAKLRKRIATGSPNTEEYASLGERLEELAARHLENAEQQIEFLKEAISLATAFAALEKEESEDALTRIFREYRPEDAPEILDRIVADIDSIVRKTRGRDDWAQAHGAARVVKKEIRIVLNKYGLPKTGDLFERVYGYVSENY